MSILMQLNGVSEAGRLQPLSAQVNAGEILHLVGPNGAGKSTLLVRMAGLSSGQGEILLQGESLSRWSSASLASRRAYLAQQQTAPFAMPVWHYLTLHQHNRQQKTLLSDVAAMLGIEDKLSRHVSQLSGGEWQRVRLAAVILQIHPQGNGQPAGSAAVTGGADEQPRCCPAGGAGQSVKRPVAAGYCGGDEQS